MRALGALVLGLAVGYLAATGWHREPPPKIQRANEHSVMVETTSTGPVYQVLQLALEHCGQRPGGGFAVLVANTPATRGVIGFDCIPYKPCRFNSDGECLR